MLSQSKRCWGVGRSQWAQKHVHYLRSTRNLIKPTPYITDPISTTIHNHFNASRSITSLVTSQCSSAISGILTHEDKNEIDSIHRQHRIQHHDRNHESLSNLHQLDQRRFMGRKDGNKAFYKPRRPTKKQQKRYHNRKREQHYKMVGRHSKPGSKAGPRREEEARDRQFQLDQARGLLPDMDDDDDELEYDFGDAIMDDLMGNTSHLTSLDTPAPTYIGHMYEQNYTIVSNLMKHFLSAKEREREADVGEDDDSASAKAIESYAESSLPSDAEISSLLRSFRDKFSTKHKPLGIARALSLLLDELKVPTTAFGEYTFTTLMTCASTPFEAKRIMKMMVDTDHPISSYSYSILVDTYAKRGDFRGADEVLSEMKQLCDAKDSDSTVEPTLAAYTSLLAACYKVINTGAAPTSIKAEAGVVAWERWKEMRIRGLDADAMAYGAIIRIMAARGLPERAINLVEEMETFNVKPTTLVFSSALRAVARSHANSLRYQGGNSRNHKRRERVAAHHGKMARQLVIMAENAEIDQNDDGYISALMLCAATAGDTATTKAIYLASEVRKLEHLRTIGNTESLSLDGGDSSISSYSDIVSQDVMPSLEPSLDPSSAPTIANEASISAEREYGLDTRKLSALLHTNASAIDKKGIGDVWAGRENRGYLCANSQRLIVARQKPEYVNKQLPGVKSSDMTNMDWQEDNYEEMSKKDRRKPFEGVGEFDRNNSIDDLDPDVQQLLFDRDTEIDLMTNQNRSDAIEAEVINRETANQMEAERLKEELFAGTGDSDVDPDKFDDFVVKLNALDESEEVMPKELEDFFNVMKGFDDDVADDNDETFNEKELDFIKKSNLFGTGANSPLDGFVPTDLDNKLGELLESMNDENADPESLQEIKMLQQQLFEGKSPEEVEEMEKELFGDTSGVNEQLDDLLASMHDDTIDPSKKECMEKLEEELDRIYAMKEKEIGEVKDASAVTSSNDLEDAEIIVPSDEMKGDEIDLILDGLPQSRIQKVREAFKSSFGTPSMLKLVPILRENMPDFVNKDWLRTKNLKDAHTVIRKAEADGILDVHLMNSMLKVYAKAGRINLAMDYHEEEYTKKGIMPTQYSDRIIVEMLLQNKRLGRALKFKEEVEKRGSSLDLLSYGSLIQHLGSRGQLGSALLMLKECIATTGSPPGEKYVKDIRQLCRDNDLEEKVGLEQMIGKDPMAWFRRGEAIFKRSRGKRRRQTIQFASRAGVRI